MIQVVFIRRNNGGGFRHHLIRRNGEFFLGGSHCLNNGFLGGGFFNRCFLGFFRGSGGSLFLFIGPETDEEEENEKQNEQHDHQNQNPEHRHSAGELRRNEEGLRVNAVGSFRGNGNAGDFDVVCRLVGVNLYAQSGVFGELDGVVFINVNRFYGHFFKMGSLDRVGQRNDDREGFARGCLCKCKLDRLRIFGSFGQVLFGNGVGLGGNGDGRVDLFCKRIFLQEDHKTVLAGHVNFYHINFCRFYGQRAFQLVALFDHGAGRCLVGGACGQLGQVGNNVVGANLGNGAGIGMAVDFIGYLAGQFLVAGDQKHIDLVFVFVNRFAAFHFDGVVNGFILCNSGKRKTAQKENRNQQERQNAENRVFRIGALLFHLFSTFL